MSAELRDRIESYGQHFQSRMVRRIHAASGSFLQSRGKMQGVAAGSVRINRPALLWRLRGVRLDAPPLDGHRQRWG